MSWIISNALNQAYENSRCSLERAAESLEENSLDGAQFAPWSETPTPQAFLSPDRMTEFCRLSRFGMTFAPLTEDHGAGLLTWFREAFLARTSARQDEAQESPESAADSGAKWHGSFARWDRNTSSWKTHQFSLLGGLESFSETWPRWGIMRDGGCWELSTLERLTSENESGLWRTPTVGMLNADRAKDPEYGQRKLAKGQTITLADQVKDSRMWPTPITAYDGRTMEAWEAAKAKTKEKLKAGHYKKGCGAPGLMDLQRAVMIWPTPQARDYKGAPGKGCQERGGHQSSLPAEIGGTLNPTWTEWLMGWPLGWTDSKPLETDKFQQWFDSHGKPSADELRETK